MTDHQKPEISRQNTLGKKGIILLMFSFVFSFCYQFIHPTVLSQHFQHMPGIGLTISQWALMILALALGQNKLADLKSNKQGIFLLLCAAFLGGSYGIFGNNYLRLMNLPVLIFVTAQALFSLLKANESPALSARGLWEGLRRLFPGCFIHFALPFRALGDLIKTDRKRLNGLGTGLIFSVAICLIAVCLLSSADRIFSGIVEEGVISLGRVNGTLIIRLIFALAGSLTLFSLLYSALIQPRELDERPPASLPPALAISMVLSALALVYGLFVYVQFKYLFGNQETALLAGGYAEYARSGFFQLVLLSFLTLALILPTLSLYPGQKYLRCICAIVALLTVIIDFSAFFRMRLYIQAYGLSLLRIITIWGMAMIFIALLLAIAKCIFPGFKLSVPLAAAVLCSWLLLNYSNVDLQIARYNVNAYNQGALTELDVHYFTDLSPDVLPALDEIADEELRETTKKEFQRIMKEIYPAGYDWALCWEKIKP